MRLTFTVICRPRPQNGPRAKEGSYLDMFDSESETDVPSDSSDEELVEV